VNALVPQVALTQQPAPATETFRLITDAAALEALAPAWQELLEASSHPEPTLAPPWLLTWWEIYGHGRRLAVGAWHEGKQLVGLAPLCRVRAWHRPGIPFRRLEFLGSDVPQDDGVCSDYLNVIARTGHEDRVVQALVRSIQGGVFGSWDECVFARMDGSGQMPQRLRDAFTAAGYQTELTQISAAPYLPLPSSWDDYLRGLPQQKRYTLTSTLRRFEKWAPAGQWALERAQTPEQLKRGMSILADLHRERWQADNEPGAFISPRFVAFHDRYARQLLERGQLDLTWLIVRGEPVAALYNFIASRKMCFYQSGRKMNVPGEVRVGVLILIFAIQHAITLGLQEFDFLAGDYDYKRKFTPQARPIVTLRVVRPGLREWLRRTARSAWQRLRQRLPAKPAANSGC
jgi:CelD/BcsL family acetyltransferase involved in cellulose biosynthesis